MTKGQELDHSAHVSELMISVHFFVRQYVTAKVDGWETLDDAQQWILGSSFVVQMNRIWAMLLRHNLVIYF